MHWSYISVINLSKWGVFPLALYSYTSFDQCRQSVNTNTRCQHHHVAVGPWEAIRVERPQSWTWPSWLHLSVALWSWQLSARLWYLHCVSNGDTTVKHLARWNDAGWLPAAVCSRLLHSSCDRQLRAAKAAIPPGLAGGVFILMSLLDSRFWSLVSLILELAEHCSWNREWTMI